jgi:aspartate aminotransferase-like enzyme
VKRVSPDTLVILDAVCAVASEDIQMDKWGIDVVISASQKGLGAPPGLSIVIASQKAMKVKSLSLCARRPSTAIDGFVSVRSLRRVRNRSRRTMPAGRGKTFHSMTRLELRSVLTTGVTTDGSLS